MGYMHINNLYKDTRVLEFKKLYAMEKIHGTSSSILWKNNDIQFIPGGCKMETFLSIFNIDELKAKFIELGHEETRLYGEQYGGRQQGMATTYGKDPKFIVFEVRVGDTWLNVAKAANVTRKLGLEFVHYEEIDATIEAIEIQRDTNSIQAIRNGMGTGHKREGVVLRPLEEYVDNRGNRVMAKHKGDEFKETSSPRAVGENLEQKTGQLAAFEWVTDMRLQHVLDALRAQYDELGMQHTEKIIDAMLEDIEREGGSEIIMNKYTRKAISSRTVQLWKKCREKIHM